MWRSALGIGAAKLPSVSEIAPKSPFLSVNIALSAWYDVRGDAKDIRYSNVNIALKGAKSVINVYPPGAWNWFKNSYSLSNLELIVQSKDSYTSNGFKGWKYLFQDS